MSRPTAEQMVRAHAWVCAQEDEAGPGCARAVFIRDAVRIAEEYAQAEVEAATAELVLKLHDAYDLHEKQADLILRQAAAERERDEARAERDKACRDAKVVIDQARAIQCEYEKALGWSTRYEARCYHCGLDIPKGEDVKAHVADCPQHPAVQRLVQAEKDCDAARAEVERVEANRASENELRNRYYDQLNSERDQHRAEAATLQARAEKAEAEVGRLRERVDALLGLLGTARDVIHDHVGASDTVLLDALDAALAPDAKEVARGN